MRPTRTLAVALLIVLSTAALGAQNMGATLQGLITDAQNAVLPGVTVTITNVDTGVVRTVLTDTTGWYRAAALMPGTYKMSMELSGFVTFKRGGMTLTTGQEPRIDVTMQVASVAETVEVIAATPLVDVTKNTIGTTVTRKDLDSMPLVSRNFLDLFRRRVEFGPRHPPPAHHRAEGVLDVVAEDLLPHTRLLVFQGASDGPRFRQWARANQCRTDVWYSAYPELSMPAIDNNSAIREGLSPTLDTEETQRWLTRF